MIQHHTPHFSKITLQDVTESNREEVIRLTGNKNQHDFMPDVASSLKGLEKYPDARPLAITAGNEVVGFALYGIDEVTGTWKIFRLLIDKQHQGRGLGKQALKAIVTEMKEKREATDILICYDEHNEVARRMYISFGFEEYGKNGSKILAKLPS